MQVLPKRFLSLLTAFCVVLLVFSSAPVGARAEETVISKVLTTLSATPVVMDDPALITVATSTQGCHIISAGWYDSGGKAASGSFNAETYRLEINIGADSGYTIDPEVACYLNNSAISCVVSDDHSSVVLTRDYTAEVWAPTVYKNPGAETVNEGGWASFVVSGAYVLDYEWAVTDSNSSVTIPVSQIKSRFPGMDYTGDGTTKLILYNIPYEMNGWGVVCNFIGVGSGNVTRSKPALLTVKPDPSRVVETPAPSPTPTPEATPEPTPSAPVEEPAPVEHVHQYSEQWLYDARGHWHECPEDHVSADEGLHVFRWETDPSSSDEETVETGTCEICGYTTTRHTSSSGAGQSASGSASEGGSESSTESGEDVSGENSKAEKASPSGLRPTPLMIVLLALIPIDAVLIALHARRSAARRRRRR